MKAIYAEDSKVRTAPKLTFSAVNPFNSKLNVALATATFHSATVAACKSYLLQRTDLSSFLALFSG